MKTEYAHAGWSYSSSATRNGEIAIGTAFNSVKSPYSNLWDFVQLSWIKVSFLNSVSDTYSTVYP